MANSPVPLKRLEFWTGIVGLLTAIVTGVITMMLQIKPIKDVVLQKPFEGLWDYSMEYDFFHGEKGAWSANGKGIILWKQDDIRYEIYLGADVLSANQGFPVLAGFSRGFIEADADGGLSLPFKIENIRYISRMSDKKQIFPMYSYSNCTFQIMNRRPDTITCNFDTKHPEGKIYSRGVARFKWESRIH